MKQAFYARHIASSNIATIAYQSAAERLYVQFHTGAIYRYEGVPFAVYQGFPGPGRGSAGRYFWFRVRLRYRGVRVPHADLPPELG